MSRAGTCMVRQMQGKSAIGHPNVVSVVSGCVSQIIATTLHQLLRNHRTDCMQSLRPLQTCQAVGCASHRCLLPAIVRSPANRLRIRCTRTVNTTSMSGPAPSPSHPPMHSEPDLKPASTLLPCQLDSYTRSGTATVLACEPVALPSKPAKGGKAGKKGASASAAGGASASNAAASNGSHQARLWCITLDGGPLYPEGGGQPSDTGILQLISAPATPPTADAAPAEAATANGNGTSSVQAAGANSRGGTELEAAAARSAPAAEEPAVAVNILSVARSGSRVLATVDAPLPVGSTVAISVDWDRRFDLMQQHTGP